MRHYECPECGRRIGESNCKGVRILRSCPRCDAMRSYERVDA